MSVTCMRTRWHREAGDDTHSLQLVIDADADIRSLVLPGARRVQEMTGREASTFVGLAKASQELKLMSCLGASNSSK